MYYINKSWSYSVHKFSVHFCVSIICADDVGKWIKCGIWRRMFWINDTQWCLILKFYLILQINILESKKRLKRKTESFIEGWRKVADFLFFTCSWKKKTLNSAWAKIAVFYTKYKGNCTNTNACNVCYIIQLFKKICKQNLQYEFLVQQMVSGKLLAIWPSFLFWETATMSVCV